MQPPPSLWWSQLDHPLAPRPALRGEHDYDVAIVGGGFTGLWTARELLRRDPTLRVAVLEKSLCGFGASGRNGGWASALYPLSDAAIVKRHGLDAYHHLRATLIRSVSDLGDALTSDGIDGHYRRGGTLTFARSEVQVQRLRRSVDDAHALGATESDVTWLDQAAARERADVAGALGATYSAHCARIQPAKVVRGIATAVERLGGVIFENTAITKILPRKGWRDASALSVEGTLRARFIVRATEGFTSTLPRERRTVAPIYSLMVATTPQSAAFWQRVGLRNYETFADDRHVIIYGQRTEDDRIAFGGRGAPYHFASTVEPRYDQSEKVFGLLTTTLHELFPDLEGGITHSWGGPLAMPRDHSPSVLVDHERGLASAGGYTGDGVVLSYVAANALADLISTPQADTGYTRLPFVGHRAKRWEVEPLRWIGVNVGLDLAGWSDRVEQRTGHESRASAWLDRLLP